MGLKIVGIEIYTGSNLVDNEYFIEKFKREQNTDIENFVTNVLGKDKRYIANEGENTLTMASHAVDKLLAKQNIKGSDIDLIIFTSQLPEYTMPYQAALIHRHIKGSNKCIIFDMNVACLGMVRALDVCNLYMENKNSGVNRALIIGSDKVSCHSQEADSAVSTIFGDGACALLVERSEESYVLGAETITLSHLAQVILFPECGLSNVSRYKGDSAKILWNPPSVEEEFKSMHISAEKLFNRLGITSDDIDHVCCSQFTSAEYKRISEALNIPIEKIPYVGDKYGYTGTSSPFFVLKELIDEDKIKRGDLILFTSIGLGTTACSIVIKY